MASIIRPVYDWALNLSGKPNAVWALAIISFVESSVFPIPPDLLLIPMVLAARNKAFHYAFICTVASVAGGFLGYAIGYLLFDTLGRQVLAIYGLVDKYEELQASLNGPGWWIFTWPSGGFWVIVAKGATPIPYKLVTLTAGFVKFDPVQFAAASFISRAMRFFLVAGLLWWFGEPMRAFVEKRLTLVTTLALVLVIGGFVLAKVIL
jgi:membrane protein YqaA with SNARE-associated domain